MGEIKFRAWDIRSKRMLPIIQSIHFEPEGDMSHPYNCVEFVIPGKAAGYISLDKIVLMQFTGLKDKKRTEEYPEGQEIYEGDILGSDRQPGSPYIVWNKEKARWGLSNKHYDQIFSPELCEVHGEIIGNIHQNPELTEAQNRN